MKCQSLISGKKNKKKNIINLTSAECAQGVVKVKEYQVTISCKLFKEPVSDKHGLLNFDCVCYHNFIYYSRKPGLHAP